MQKFGNLVILLVEDDFGDQKLLQKALQHEKILNELKIVCSAEDALQYLQRSRKGDEETPMPDLILLDLNMPGMGGKEFLKCIKEDSELNSTPVVVLTTSDSEQDIFESYQLQAAGYIKKPITLQEFQRVMEEFKKILVSCL